MAGERILGGLGGKPVKGGNLFSQIPLRVSAEIFETLLETPNFRLERILSEGQATPPGVWLDQETTEWVVVLRGRAGLRFEDETGLRILGPGDYVHIDAHRRHRVEWTDPKGKTVWLAIHYKPSSPLPPMEAEATPWLEGPE